MHTGRLRLINHTGAPLRTLRNGTTRNMAALSLRQAAQQAGVSKSTILRAIQKGRVSSTRTADGGHAIDPAELARVYPGATAQRTSTDAMGQDAPAAATDENEKTLTTKIKLKNKTTAYNIHPRFLQYNVMCR